MGADISETTRFRTIPIESLDAGLLPLPARRYPRNPHLRPGRVATKLTSAVMPPTALRWTGTKKYEIPDNDQGLRAKVREKGRAETAEPPCEDQSGKANIPRKPQRREGLCGDAITVEQQQVDQQQGRKNRRSGI